jgi:steroid delta-isomerase-like uncharacterized protein
MATEGNEAVLHRYYNDVLNSGNISLLEGLAVLDYTEHDPLPSQRVGLDGLRDRVRMLRDGLSPHFTIEDVIAQADKVVVRWTNAGTHVGEFFGIPPTGRSFQFGGIDIHRLQDGRMAEHWHVVDIFSMLQQLGVLSQLGLSEQ